MLLQDLVQTSSRIAASPGRLNKVALLAELLGRTEPEEIEIAVAYLSGELRQGRPGIGPALLRDAMPRDAAEAPALTLSAVDRTFEGLAETGGAGSIGERRRLLHDLLVRATREEQAFLAHLVSGELRQGALSGVMADAVARAAGLSPAQVRRAAMVHGELGAVARLALTQGEPGLASLSVRLFQPIQPMLAGTADDIADALEQLGEAGLEHKLDGARIQVHKGGDEVRVFSRRLNDVTAAVPEIVEAVRILPAREIILDGEALALRPDGTPHPFQTTMSRFGRRLDVDAVRQSVPLSPFFFDCMFLDGESLVDREAAERFRALADRSPTGLRVTRLVTGDARRAQAFLEEALERGQEGIVAKALAAPYEAGRRGRSWLKLKPARTLDLVVLAAEWGHGRRRGWLSNLHLGARDPATGAFVMLGKTFKGMTDEVLAWQTARLVELALTDDGHLVRVRPQLVVEIAFNEIQSSPRYPGGFALRFARLKGYRPDKRPQDADTIDTVRAIHQRSSGHG